jgi:elongation factor 3
MGRQKLKKSLQYDIKWQGLDHKFNTWIPRDELLEKGFQKIVSRIDDLEASREGVGKRDTSAHIVRKHLEDIGLDGDIAQCNEIAGPSGGKSCFHVCRKSRFNFQFQFHSSEGQKIKLVIAACLWNNPQVRLLCTPRYLSRLKGDERSVSSTNQATT